MTTTPESSTQIFKPLVVNCAIAALTLGGTLRAAYEPKLVPSVCWFDQGNSSKEFIPPPPASSSVSLSDRETHENIAESLVNTLSRHGLVADRRQRKAKGSILLEFLRGRQSCVDIHPTGEIVVIVREGDIDNVFTLGVEDVGLIVELVRDGIDG